MIVETVSIELDMKDPDAAYASIRGKDTYLLESAEGGEKVARYSFIGFNAIAKLTIADGKVDFTCDSSLDFLKPKGDDPLKILRNLMSQFEFKGKGKGFFGGFVGYFSYDLVRYYIKLEKNKDELNEPDCEFILAKNNIIFDHKAGKTMLTQNCFGECDEEAVKKELDTIASSLSFSGFKEEGKRKLDITSNMSKEEFEGIVKRTKQYIVDGDVIQAVMSQRFETDFEGDTFNVFRKLKEINPSPYMYHLDLVRER